MGSNDKGDGSDQQKVIARSLAYLALYASGKSKETLLSRANFLSGLGLSAKELAEVLGTSVDSLGVLRRRAKGRKGGKRGKRE